ncbi:MAG: DNA helicase RecQ [Candidatus Brocadiaceae bacterium]|nr:DNA helicase RecQ [Candidatus Brocadiaceae bacterium]
MLRETLRKYWGFEGFLPLQQDAMESVLEGRDSLVVLPTGGGKSLCYQAPAGVLPGTAVVVSPLISLMKDQVDALAECGVAAARYDSSLSTEERRGVMEQFRAGALKMLYVSPERLVSERFTDVLRAGGLSFIAVDEAHCVSMWGHDFRPDYRRLDALKEVFPGIAVHAYTATATQQVREDIVQTLRLEAPRVMVGSFDRPNLVYRARPAENRPAQVRGVIDAHPGQAGIVYCIRRADVDETAAELQSLGYRALPYHAGMEDGARRRNQDAFSRGEADIVVATVAFGMGIDKPDVRYVIHAGMTKTLEEYQQQAGRAGRDGLESECWVFYSGNDYHTWKFILSDSDPEMRRIHMRKLSEMYSFCTDVSCRHRTLVEYFGQPYGKADCGACDFCLGEVACLEDSLETAQKILSCVARLRQRYGAAYTAGVLTGANPERVVQNGHDGLSTYGLLSEYPARQVRNWIEQLLAQRCLTRTAQHKVLKLTREGAEVLRGERTPRLSRPAGGPVRPMLRTEDPWDGVDPDLYGHLRALRKRLADRLGVPAFVVFGDATLRDLCRRRPHTPEEFRAAHGVGDRKCRQYAEPFIEAIRKFERGGQ